MIPWHRNDLEDGFYFTFYVPRLLMFWEIRWCKVYDMGLVLLFPILTRKNTFTRYRAFPCASVFLFGRVICLRDKDNSDFFRKRVSCVDAMMIGPPFPRMRMKGRFRLYPVFCPLRVPWYLFCSPWTTDGRLPSTP